MVSYSERIAPLTKEVFGPDGQGKIRGGVTACGHGSDLTKLYPTVQVGDHGDPVFYHHPTLFNEVECPEVEISLEDGLLVCREASPFNKGLVSNGKLYKAEPWKLQPVTVDLILLWHETIVRQNVNRQGCAMPDCEGSRKSELDPRRTALMKTDRNECVAICRKCYRRLLDAIPEIEDLKRDMALGSAPQIWFKGWDLPFHAQVVACDGDPLAGWRLEARTKREVETE